MLRIQMRYLWNPTVRMRLQDLTAVMASTYSQPRRLKYFVSRTRSSCSLLMALKISLTSRRSS